MWYLNDYSMNGVSALDFLRSALRLLSDTLTELWSVPVFGFFLLFSLAAVIYALLRYVLYASRAGVKL